MEKTYRIGLESGDISLVVHIVDEEEKRPPQKRRKLNDGTSDESVSGLSQDSNSNKSSRPVVKVSSAILRAASPVFDQMLTTDMKEKESNEIIINAQSVKDVDNLVYFMCTNKLRDDADPRHLFPFGHMYQMDRLMEYSAKKIVETVTVASYVQTVHLLEKYGLESELQSLAKFGKSHVAELEKQDDFDTLSSSHRVFALGVVKK